MAEVSLAVEASRIWKRKRESKTKEATLVEVAKGRGELEVEGEQDVGHSHHQRHQPLCSPILP